MGEEIASLYASIGADLSGLDKGLAGAEQGLAATASQVGLLDKQVKAAGVNLGTTNDLLSGLGVALPISPMQVFGQALAFSVGQAAEAEEVLAQTEAVIASTGGAAGVSAEQVTSLAAALQRESRFSDDAIQSGENLLLTFTNIGSDVFPAATQAMVDMAAALKTDVKGGAIQLGKALNDPIAGISALQRVGVSFTSAQKNVIKALVETGDVAGAQQIILAELNKEFGGSAQAAAETYAGSIDQAKNAVGDLGEMMGDLLLPNLTAGITTFTDWARTVKDGADALDDGRWSLLDWAQASAEVVWTGKTLADVQAELADETAAQQAPVEAATSRWQGLAEQYTTTTTAAETYSNQLSSQTQWLADLAAAGPSTVEAYDAVAAANDRASAAADRLNMILGGAVGNEMQAFQDKQGDLVAAGDALRAKIDELNQKQYLTPAQAEELAALNVALGENVTAVEDNVKAHEDATERILFGYLQQALAVDGLTLTEIKALTGVAEQWGLLDKDTATAVDGILDSAEDLASGGSVAEFMNQVNGVRDAWLGVPTDVTTTYHINTVGQMPSYTPNGGNANAFAAGGSYGPGPRVVGEQGPELDWPSSGGYVMNNSDSNSLIGALEAIASGGAGGGNSGGADMAEIAAVLRGLPAAVGRAVRDGIAASL